MRRLCSVPSLEVILTIAHREAGARRHTHLTLEHLLYRARARYRGREDPLRRRRRSAAAPHGSRRVPDASRSSSGAAAASASPSRRCVPPRAPDRRAARPERRARRGAVGRRPRSDAAGAEVVRGPALAAQGVTRLDVLNFISHGIAKVPVERRRGRGDPAPPPRADEDEESADCPESARRVHDQPERTRRGRRSSIR